MFYLEQNYVYLTEANTQESKKACSIILEKALVEVFISNKFKDISVREIHLVNIDQFATLEIINTFKRSNFFTHIGQNKVWIVKNGTFPFVTREEVSSYSKSKLPSNTYPPQSLQFKPSEREIRTGEMRSLSEASPATQAQSSIPPV